MREHPPAVKEESALWHILLRARQHSLLPVGEGEPLSSAVDARKAPASPNGHGPAGRHSVARREATTPGCRQQPRASGRKGSHVPAKKSTTSPRGQAEATAKGRSKVFRSERARKKSRKGRTKFLSLGSGLIISIRFKKE